MNVQIVHLTDNEVRTVEIPSWKSCVLIGRGDSSDILLNDRSVSRHHARLFIENGLCWIEDAGSRGGTRLNNELISGRVKLSGGDKITIGSFQLSVPGASSETVPSKAPEEKPRCARSAEKAELPFLEGFEEAQLLYTPETMKLKTRIHSYVLAKMNLPEIALKDLANDEMASKLEECLDQTLRELRHELPTAIPLDVLRQTLLDELLRYGPISPLLRMPNISEIMINGPDNIFVESKGKLYKTGIRFYSESHLLAILQRIVEPLGRHVDSSSPMVDARLPDGSRVNAIIPPLAIHGAAVTIRKFSEKKLTTDDLVEYGSLTKEMGLFLQEAVRSRQNILVSGGTGSGKTTLLNILSQFIPKGERVITVEDSAELKLSHENIVSLEARPANTEGEGKVTIRDLVINTLRMRPDRIIVGECRGAEALDMLQAMNTGHDGSLTTCHANNPRDALGRLENMVMMAGFELPSAAIREQISSALDLIVQQSRFPDGSRKIVKITEVTGREGDVVLLQDIFEFRQEGFDEKGRVIGIHTPTGNIPHFIEELREAGDLRLDMSVFVPRS